MKTTRKISLLAQVAFGFLLLAPGTALAQAVWTHAASACAVDEDSAAKYEVSAARFRFKGANTGEITARCNVINPLDNGGNPDWQWHYLEVVYADPDGRDAGSQVTAVLYKVHSNGGVSEVATFNSNDFDINNNLEPKGVSFNHAFDFHKYAYFVQLKVKRGSSSATPSVSAVRLREAPIE